MAVKIDVVTNSAVANKDLQQINTSLQSINKSAGKVSSTVSTMLTGLVSAASIIGVYTKISSVADQFTNLGNRIALVTGRTKDLAYSQTKLLDIVVRTRSTLDNTADTFSTFGKSLRDTGATIDQILKATESAQAAIAISGSSAESARSAMVQLGQGLQSGTLRGQELNSVMEQTPRIAQAIADSMGVSLGKLRALAEEGKITSDVVFKSLLDQAKKINAEFALLNPTLRQSTSILGLSVNSFINELDKGLGLSAGISKTIIDMAHAINRAATNIGADATVFLANFRMGLSDVLLIAKPILSLVGALGRQLLLAMPSLEITNTLKGRVLESLRSLDDAFGGFFGFMYKQYRFFWTDLFAFDSPVEKAIKALQRLDPRNWATGRLDAQTMGRFFSTQTIYLYAQALQNLATAVANNMTFWGNQISHALRVSRQGVTDFSRFIGAIPDTLITLKIGGVDQIMESIAEISRGFLHLSRKVWDLGRLFRDIAGQSYIQLFNILIDAIKAAPGAIASSFTASANFISRAILNISQILVDFWSTSFSQPIISVRGELSAFGTHIQHVFHSLTGTSLTEVFTDIISKAKRMTSDTLSYIQDFANRVIAFFKRIYDEVIGGSWWTDTMDGMRSKAISSFNIVLGYISHFVASAIGFFKRLYLAFATTEFDPFSNLSYKLNRAAAVLTVFGFTVAALFNPAGALGIAVALFSEDMYKALTRRTPWEKFKGFVKDAADSFYDITRSLANFELFLGQMLFRVADKGTVIGSRMQESLAKGFMKRNLQFKWQFSTSTLDKMLAHIDYIFTSIAIIAIGSLDIAAKAVLAFCTNVINYFKTVYEKVIGHSYWTDTINGVVREAESLLPRAQRSLALFASYVQNIFDRIFSRDNTFKDIAVKLYIVDQDLGRTIFESLYMELSRYLVKIRTEVPEVFRAAMLSAGALAVHLLFPKGTFRAALVSLIIGAVLTSGTLAAERFGGSLFGQSFVTSAAYGLGEVVGTMITDVVHELPSRLKVVFGIISGFFKGFATQLPLLIGGLFKGIFKITDILGVSGPLGLLGTALLGAGLVPLLSQFKSVKKVIDAVTKAWTWFTASFSVGTVLKLSIIQQLFGFIGPFRLIGILGLIAEYLNMFDSIFAGSEIAHYAATGGLFGLLVFGKQGYNFIMDGVKQALIALIAYVNSSVAGLTGVNVISTILGAAGDKGWVVGVKKIVEEAFKRTSSIIVDVSAKYLRKGLDVATLLLFGLSPEKTVALFKDKFAEIITTLKTKVASITSYLSKFNFVNSLTSRMGQQVGETGDLFAGVKKQSKIAAKDVLRVQGDLFGGITAAATSANKAALAVGGEYGIMGKIFYGTSGKPWTRGFMIGGALLLLAGLAQAASDATSKASYSVMDELLNSAKYFIANNPITSYAVILSPLLLGLFYQLAKVAVPLLGTALRWAFSVENLMRFQKVAAGTLDFIKTNTKGLAVSGVAGGIAAGAAAVAGADPFGIMLAVASATILTEMFPGIVAGALAMSRGVLTALGFITVGFFGVEAAAISAWAAAAAPIALVVAAIAGIGAAIISVIGVGEDFGDKFADVLQRFLKFIHMTDNGLASLGVSLNKLIPEKGRKFGPIEIRYDASKVDASNISGDQKKALLRVGNKLEEARVKAKEQWDEGNTVEPELIKSIKQLNDQFEALIIKAETANRKDVIDKVGNINQFNQPAGDGWFSRLGKPPAQMALDAAHWAAKAPYEKMLKEDPQSQVARDNLDRLNKLKDTQFKAGYFKDDFVDTLQDGLNKLDFTVELHGQREMVAATQKAWSDAALDYEEKAKAYAVARSQTVTQRQEDLTGTKKKQEDAGKTLLLRSENLKALQEHSKAVTEYSKRTDALDAQLSKLGITFEEHPLFMVGNNSVEEALRVQIREVELLADAFKGMDKSIGSSAEAMATYNEKRDKTTKILEKQRQEADKSTLNADDLLSKSFGKAGVEFNVESLSGLPVQLKLALNKSVQELESAKADLKLSKYVIPPGSTVVDVERIGKELEDAKAKIREKAAGVRAEVVKAFTMPDSTASDYARLAAALNSPQPVATAAFGGAGASKKRTGALTEKGAIEDVLKNPSISLNDKQLKHYSRRIYDLDQQISNLEWTPRIQSFNSVLSEMSAIGASLDLTDLISIPPDVIRGMMRAGVEVGNINEQLGRAGTQGMPLSEITKMAEKKFKIQVDTEQKILKFKKKTAQEEFQNLQTIAPGITQATAITLPDQVWTEFDALDYRGKEIALQMKNIKFSDPRQMKEFLKQLEDVRLSGRALAEDSFTFGEQYNFVNTIFSDIGLTADDWAKATRDTRIEMTRLARETRNIQESLDSNRDLSEADIKAKREIITLNKKQSATNLESTRSLARNTADSVGRAGGSLDEATARTLPASTLRDVQRQSKAIEEAMLSASKELTDEGKYLSFLAIKKLQENLISTIEIAIDKTAKNEKLFDTVGLSVSKDAYNTLDRNGRNILEGMARAIQDQEAIIKKNKDDPAIANAAQAMIDSIRLDFNTQLFIFSARREDTAAYQAGQNLIGNMKNALQTGIADFLMGRITSKNLLTSVVDTFTSSIVDTFVNGMLQAITGPRGIFEKIIGGMGEGIFAMGKGIFKGNSKREEAFAATAMQEAATAMRELSGVLLSMVPGFSPDVAGGPEADNEAIAKATTTTADATSNLGSTFITGLGGIGRILKGDILGGLTMIVTALQASSIGKSAIKGLGGLSGILGGTSGSGGIMGSFGDMFISMFGASKGAAFDKGVKMFASGGIVNSPTLFRMAKGGLGLMGEAGPEAIMPLVRGSNGKLGVANNGSSSQAVFNINITGDVSRQTRSEIQRMIPQIASGVNQHNYEKGYQR